MLKVQQQFMDLPESKKQRVLLLLEEFKKEAAKALRIIDEITEKDN